MVLAIVPIEHNLISKTGREQLAYQGLKLAISVTHRPFVTGITYPWSNCIFGGRETSIMNIIWMKIMDQSLISSVPVEDLVEQASIMIPKFYPGKFIDNYERPQISVK
jgi:hypothetical protein